VWIVRCPVRLTPKPWVTIDIDITNEIEYIETRDSFFRPFNTHEETKDGG